MSTNGYEHIRNDLGVLEGELADAYQAGAISRRTFLVRGSVLGLSAATLGSILAACGGDEESSDTTTAPAGGDDAPAPTEAPAGGSKEGGILRVAAQRPGSPLDPVAMDNIGSYTPVVMSMEYLAGIGEGAALAPMLAESWSPNDDGSVWTFNIRQGVKWHSGDDFTAEHVVGALDRLAASNLSAYIDPGSAVVDGTSVVVTLKNPDGQFPYQVSPYNPQSVMTPPDYAPGTLFDQNPNGTSAFKLDTYDVATGANYVRFDDWWGGKVAFDGVEIIFSDDNATQINSVIAGETDALIQFGVSDADALFASDDRRCDAEFRLKRRKQDAISRQFHPTAQHGPFSTSGVANDLDRQALADTGLPGRGDVGNDHPVAPVYEFFDPTSPTQRERDIDRAKALLEEAGAAGLSITMHAPELQEIALLAEVVQSQLSEIGMNITLNVESTSTFYNRWCAVYDSETPPAGCDGGEEFGIVDYGNRGTPDVYLVKAYATGEWNSAHYLSDEFNAAVAKYQAALDLEGRKAAITEVQEIAHRDIPYVIPYFYNTLSAWRKNVTGIRHTGLGHFYLGNASFTA
ncbi:MAG: ABC transporter substrate-binding protein [Ilumatobacteraceae bacterium]